MLGAGLGVEVGFILGLIVGLGPLLGVGFTGLTRGFKVGLGFRKVLRVGFDLMGGLSVGLINLGLGVGLALGLGVGFFTGTLGVGLAALGFAVGLTKGFCGRGFFTSVFLVGFGWTSGLALGVGLVGLVGLLGLMTFFCGMEVV